MERKACELQSMADGGVFVLPLGASQPLKCQEIAQKPAKIMRTSSALLYLPAHHFVTVDQTGIRETSANMPSQYSFFTRGLSTAQAAFGACINRMTAIPARTSRPAEPYVVFVSLVGVQVTQFVRRRERLFAVEERAYKVAHDDVIIVRDQTLLVLTSQWTVPLGCNPPASVDVGVGVVKGGFGTFSALGGDTLVGGIRGLSTCSPRSTCRTIG